MTEQEWLECDKPMQMVRYLRRRKASPRKWRLVAVACCRRRWHLLTDQRSRQAILVAEQYADGEVSKEVLTAAHQEAYDVYLQNDRSVLDPGRDALGAAAGAAMTIPGHALDRTTWKRNPSEVLGILREIFPNLFRPVSGDPSWLTPTVVSLAQTIYDDRAFDRIPILGDALEEAGCTNQDFLDHCRGSGPHVRGCWAVDLLLGKG